MLQAPDGGLCNWQQSLDYSHSDNLTKNVNYYAQNEAPPIPAIIQLLFKDKASAKFPPEQIHDYEQWFKTEVLCLDLEEIFPDERDDATGSTKVYTIEDIVEALPK